MSAVNNYGEDDKPVDGATQDWCEDILGELEEAGDEEMESWERDLIQEMQEKAEQFTEDEAEAIGALHRKVMGY